MKTSAVVLIESNKPLEIIDLEVPKLRRGQVLVEVAFSGVCYTQVLEWRGYRGVDPYLPHCLGHEGSGSVLEIGDGVTKVERDDHVILSWIKGSGINAGGSVYSWGKQCVNAGPITTFNRTSVISEDRLTVIPSNFSLKMAALVGCALPTGLGSVFNVAQPISGQSIAIFGVGGVGLCTAMAAKVNGCTPIIAIDLVEQKLELAKAIGVTHLINASQDSVLERIIQICPDGVDFAIEATGRPNVMCQAIESVRPRGGSVVIVGNARHGEIWELDPKQLNLGKRIFGTWGGDSQPDRDYLRYCNLAMTGSLNLGAFLTPPTYALHGINSALTDLELGKLTRPIIDLSIL